MTPQQEQTLKELLVLIPVLVERKFRRGDSEHKADIQDMTVSELLNNAVEEKIDDLIYTLIALGKINRLKEKYETTDSGPMGSPEDPTGNRDRGVHPLGDGNSQP